MRTVPLKRWMVGVALVAAGALAVGCGDDDGAGSGGSGGAGSGGSGGDAGSAGTAGTGGDGGSAGTAGTGGSAGTAGTGGDGGSAGTAGTGGSAGTAGTGGDGGSAGTAGTGGTPCDPTAEAAIEVDANITTDTTWECGTYLLQDIIYVTNNATLTIEPGVRVLGDIDAPTITALISTRGSKLNAVGTEDEPIVFSSSADEGDRLPGDWGGVVLLGSASINSPTCVGGTGATCDGGHFENTIEGLDPTAETSKYGGTDDAWNCGHLEYVRIEFAGYELAPNVELNSLSVGGCGTGTTLSHIQAHHGSDDGIEMFGGTAGLDHVVISQSSDDGLDWDLGWRGKVQFLVIHQTQDGNDGDKGIEADNLGADEDALPRSKPVIYNATMIGNAAKTGMLLREGTQGELRNFIVQGFAIGVDLNAAMTMSTDLSVEWPTNLSIEDSCFFDNGEIGDSDSTDDDKGFNENDAIVDAARSNVTNVDPMLGSIDNATPDYIPASTMLGGKAMPPAGMDTAANYCGAFAHDGDDWTAGWTSFPAG